MMACICSCFQDKDPEEILDGSSHRNISHHNSPIHNFFEKVVYQIASTFPIVTRGPLSAIFMKYLSCIKSLYFFNCQHTTSCSSLQSCTTRCFFIMDKVWLQIDLKLSFPTYYVTIYKAIQGYYINKSHNSLKKVVTKITHGWALQLPRNGLEQDSSKPIWSQTFFFYNLRGE